MSDLDSLQGRFEEIGREVEAFVSLRRRTTFAVRRWDQKQGDKIVGTWWSVASDHLDHSGKLATQEAADRLAEELNRKGRLYQEALASRLIEKMRAVVAGCEAEPE